MKHILELNDIQIKMLYNTIIKSDFFGQVIDKQLQDMTPNEVEFGEMVEKIGKMVK